MNFDLLKHTILLSIAGSRSYGIHRSDSDIDLKGVCIPPAKYIVGALSHFEQDQSSDEIAIFTDLLSSSQKEIVKREKLEEEESTIRSKERREFESEEPLKYLPNRIESLSGDIRRFKDKRKFEESGNDTVIQEERRIDVQLAEFDRIETRLEL